MGESDRAGRNQRPVRQDRDSRPRRTRRAPRARRQGAVAAILAAHNAVEDIVRSIAVAANINDAASLGIDKLTPALIDRDLIDNRTADALAGLMTLRNLAVHGPEPEGRRGREYIVLAEGVLYALSHSRGARGAPTDDATP